MVCENTNESICERTTINIFSQVALHFSRMMGSGLPKKGDHILYSAYLFLILL